MAKLSKREQKFTGVDSAKFYGVDEALNLVKTNATAKFDETVEVALNLETRGTEHCAQVVAELERAGYTLAGP